MNYSFHLLISSPGRKSLLCYCRYFVSYSLAFYIFVFSETTEQSLLFECSLRWNIPVKFTFCALVWNPSYRCRKWFNIPSKANLQTLPMLDIVFTFVCCLHLLAVDISIFKLTNHCLDWNKLQWNLCNPTHKFFWHPVTSD